MSELYIKADYMSGDRIGIILSALILCLMLIGCGEAEQIMVIEDTAEKSVYVDDPVVEDSCLYVYVCGAVSEEGVYKLNAGDRVVDAIQLAGGFSEDACTNAINLSEKLSDEQRIYIPTIDEMQQVLEIKEDDGCVNINTADEEKLTELTGIGQTRAKAIIEYRESHGGFNEIEEIMNVSGIGQASFEKIKDSIKVR